MRLLASYNVWNDDLLENSIANIINHVDHILICWQKLSYHGQPGKFKPFDHPKISYLEFDPDLKRNPKKNERLKLIEQIQWAKGHGYTHILPMATDHFYVPTIFKNAKKEVEERDYDTTATPIFTYYKHPTFRLDPPENYFCPFICKLKKETTVKHGDFPVYIDPAMCIYPSGRFKLMENIHLHHYSMIRKNISKKLNNAASRQNFEKKIQQHINEYNSHKVGDRVSYYGGRTTIEVPNYFNL